MTALTIMAFLMAFNEQQIVTLFLNVGGGLASIAILCYAFLKEFPRQREQGEKTIASITEIQANNQESNERMLQRFDEALEKQREAFAAERRQWADERAEDRKARHANANAVNANNLATSNTVASVERLANTVAELSRQISHKG